MKLLNKLEKKLGRFAVHDLINYVIVLYALGTFLGMIDIGIYYNYFMLDIGKVLQGQVWRLFTFILKPNLFRSPFDMIFFVFALYFYYLAGHSLENAWGAFRFNLYLLSGFLLTIIAAFILYFAGMPYYAGLEYIYQSMFFAFAVLYPNMKFLVSFIIPIKVKWLAYLDGIYLIYNIYVYCRSGLYSGVIAIVVALANFLIFYFMTRNYKKLSPKTHKRKMMYKKQVYETSIGARHKCAVCGRTEEDNEQLEFRFCSKCEGNYEYCIEHLFTHEHVRKH